MDAVGVRLRHADAMRPSSARFLLLASVLVITTACAQIPAEAPTHSPPTLTSPSPTAEAASVVAPDPLIDRECDELVDPQAVSALSTTHLTSFGSEYRAIGSSRYGIPQEYSLRHLQGTVCTWHNSVPTDVDGGSEGATSLTVYLLPDATPVWSRYVEVYGDSAVEPVSCNGTEEVNARCWWTGMTADSTWVEVTYVGMKNFGTEAANIEQFSTIVDSVVASATGAPRREAWQPPDTSSPIPAGCPSVLTADAIAIAVGVPAADVDFWSGPIGGTSLLFEVENLVASDECRWLTSKTVSEYGDNYAVLRGGEWAWDDARESDPEIGAAQPLSLTGLAEGDSAWISHRPATYIDLIIDGDWISMFMWDDDLASHGVGPEAMVSMAQSVADAVR